MGNGKSYATLKKNQYIKYNFGEDCQGQKDTTRDALCIGTC
jgi:hypothetical protein